MWSYRDYSKYGSGGGGPVVIPPEAGNLTGIIITQNPTKTDYIEGESIVLDGLEVTATYDNDVRGIVTGACEIVVNDPLTVTDTSVTVSYQGFETSFDIKVYGKNLEIPAGTTHLYHFNGNYINEITGKDDLSHDRVSISDGKFDTGATGEYFGFVNAVTPTLAEINHGASFTVEAWIKTRGIAYDRTIFSFGSNSNLHIYVNANTMILNQSGNRIYNSEYIFTNWNHIALVFKDGFISIFMNGKRIIHTEVTVTDSKGLYYILKDKDIYIDEVLISTEAIYNSDFEVPTAPYGGKITLQKIYMEEKPTKTVYQSGEMFSLDGAIVKAVFSDGMIMNVTSDCTIVETTPITLSDKFRTISYTYEGVTKKLYINVGVYGPDGEIITNNSGKYLWTKYSNYLGGIDTPADTKVLMHFDEEIKEETCLVIPSMNGTAQYDTGMFGKALKLDGTNCVSLPYNNNIAFGSSDFTIAGWFYWDGTNVNSKWPCIFSHRYRYGQNYTQSGFQVQINMNTRYIDWKVDIDYTTMLFSKSTNTPTPVNEWFHLAMVRKGSSLMLFLNGKIISTNSINASQSIAQCSGAQFKIGAANITTSESNDPTDFFIGKIDEFIIVKGTALWDTDFTPPSLPYGEGGGKFERYVVSDDENAYPNADYADDGYYYKSEVVINET